MIRITFKEEKLNETLLKILKEEEFPFELPEFFQFPQGERRLTDRAEILMLAGITHLKEQYPKKNSLQSNDNNKELNLKELPIKKEEDVFKNMGL